MFNFVIYLNVVLAHLPRRDAVSISLFVDYIGKKPSSSFSFCSTCKAIKVELVLQEDWETSTSSKSWTVYTHWTHWTMSTCSLMVLRSSFELFQFTILNALSTFCPPHLFWTCKLCFSIQPLIMLHVTLFTTCRFWRNYLCLIFPVLAEHEIVTQRFDWLNGRSTEEAIRNKIPRKYLLDIW